MRITQLPVGSRGIDTVVSLTDEHVDWLAKNDYAFVVRYLGSVGPQELARILGAGLAFCPVTYAKAWSGQATVQQMVALGLPQSATVFLDVEDVSATPEILSQTIDNWGVVVEHGGFDPGGYFGAKQLLTSDELFARRIRKYWHGCSRVVDGFGEEAGPSCGWVMRQLFPPDIVLACGLEVDIDVIEKDYGGRQINFTTA